MEGIDQFALLLILAVAQFLAIVFTWKIGDKLGRSTFWSFILIAFIVIFARRIFSFLIFFHLINPGSLLESFDGIYIPLIFWIFISFGMYDLYNKIKDSRKERKKK